MKGMVISINPKYNKLDSESDFEYGLRLISIKHEDKPDDLDWQDIVEILNLDCHRDSLRKAADTTQYSGYNVMQYFKRKIEEVKISNSDDNLDSDSYMKELEIKLREIEKERQKLSVTRVQYSREIRQQSRFELFYQEIADKISLYDTPNFKPLFPINKNEKEYVLSIADIHGGAKFKSSNNEYSLNICKQRFETLLSETVSFIEEKQLNTIKILCMGDDIQGILRFSDLKINESSVVEATIFVARLLSEFLNRLSEYCNVEYYHVPTSNHSQSRPLGTKASEIASEDVEYIISNYIKDVLSNNDRVSVNLNNGKEYINIPIFDFETIAMHGHQIKNIEESLKNISYLHKKFYQFFFLAHFHAGREIISGESSCCDTEILICPSFVGSDPYSDSLFKGSKSSCKIFGFDKVKGHTETYKIVLN